MPLTNQGTLSGRYALIPRTLIFLTSGDFVLLLKGGPQKKLWANRYNGVGGHIERGEDVLTAARRELLEETGLSVPDLWLCGVITVDTGQNIGIGIYVLCGLCPRSEGLKSSEGILEWVHKKDIYQLPLVEDLPVILPRVLDMQPGSYPFSAQYNYSNDGQLKIIFGLSS